MSHIPRLVLTLLSLSLLLVLRTGSLEAAGVTRHTLLAGTRYSTEIIIVDSGQIGPTVWISGGVHGSEIAGWKAAEQIANWSVSRGKLIVVPHANKPAVQQQQRSASGDPDLNRQFPLRRGQQPKGSLATALWQELQRHNPDWVFDLHEALGNRNLSQDSVGQTIIVYPRNGMSQLANEAVQRLNREISISTQRFRVIEYPVEGSLARAAGQVLGANAAILETSRMYPLQTRINWHLRLVRYLLEGLNMNPSTALQIGPAGVAA